MSNNNSNFFSVFGGPLNTLGVKLGLIKEGGNSSKFGIVIGIFMWTILLILSVIAGKTSHFFSLNLLAGHVRFLIVIPLFFICETFVAPRMSEFVDYLTKSKLVPENELPKLEETIRKINKAKNTWVIEVVFFLLTFIFPLFITNSLLPGNSGSVSYIIQQAGGHVTISSIFYLWFCLPLFRFLILRWFWHLSLWWYFLYKTKNLKLNLMPTHSDGSGGLGYLEIVHEYFTPLSMAFSAILAASSAEEIIAGTQAFESLYYLIPVTLVLNMLFFVSPLLMFFMKLKHCKVDGLKDYMIMTTKYVDAFDKRWIKDKTSTGESQLGAPDLQSLADLTNSVNVIHDMRMVPASMTLVKALAISVIIPFLPFVFMKFNFQQLMEMVFKLITGH